jgi:prevent-host-death family protein
MPTIDIHEAKAALPRLLDALESGAEAEVIISRDGKPAARLVPLAPQRKPVRLGVLKGITETPPPDPAFEAAVAAQFLGDVPAGAK